MKNRLLFPAVLATVFTPVQAHHSSAAFDTGTTIEVAGIVTEYSFRNPHVYMTLTVTDPDGSAREVEVEAGAGSVIAPLGFTRDAVARGDRVTVVGNPGRRRPDALLLGRELYKQNGTYYPLNISSRSTSSLGDEKAQDIAGTWFSPRTSFFAFLGGSGSWALTAAGADARAAAGPQDTTHKDCIPIGSPGLLFYPVANTIEVFDDRVEMMIDWLDSVRTVWLDGRQPPAEERFLQGFSTGHWDGDALVIESSNFTAHDMGLAMNLPGSEQKHLMERLEVSADGREMLYSGVMTDPVYLSGPVEWSGTWQYSPALEHSNESCDLEAARCFLDD